MSITLITGIPGGGKSYWATHALLMKKVADKYFVVHNLPALKTDEFDQAFLRYWPDMFPEDNPGEFLTKQWHERLVKQVAEEFAGRPVLIIIDEAGLILGTENQETYAWLSWHRHLGQDIWLLVQDKKMIAAKYRRLAETEVRGVKSSVINQFLYSHKSGGVEYRLERLPAVKKVFDAYRSFDSAGAKSKQSKLVYMIFIFLGLAVLGFGVTVYRMQGGFVKKAEASVQPAKGSAGGSPGSTSPTAPKPEKSNLKKSRFSPADFLADYSFAGVVGKAVLLQGRDGALVDGRDLELYVVEIDGRCALLAGPGVDGVQRICKKSGFIKVKDDKKLPGEEVKG